MAQADTICKRVVAERSALPNIKTRADYGSVLARAGALQHAGVAELEKLKAPSSLASDWNRIVSVDRTLSGYTAAFGHYLASNDPRNARRLLRSATSLQGSIKAIAQRDGLTACSEITNSH